MTTPQSITSLHASPDAERRSRMVKYSVAMGIRLVCIGACFITPGWWMLIPATGAVLLPYLAVVAANQVNRTSSDSQAYVAPAIVPYRQGSSGCWEGKVQTVCSVREQVVLRTRSRRWCGAIRVFTRLSARRCGSVAVSMRHSSWSILAPESFLFYCET